MKNLQWQLNDTLKKYLKDKKVTDIRIILENAGCG